MKKNTKRILSAAMGASALVSAQAPVLAQQEALSQTDYSVTAAQSSAEYTKLANVQGAFSFNQDIVAPADEIFNLFGTALTGMCATPSYVLAKGEGPVTSYVNVKGDIRKSYTVNIMNMVGEGKETTRVSLCACASGPASAVGKITGVKLSDVIQMADMNEGVNAVKVVGSDGYGKIIPLQYALDKEALIVYKINGEPVPSATQFWIPETVAKYFTRDVMDIELIASDDIPEIECRDEKYQAQINILNSAARAKIAVGDEVAFEGYADDLGDPIAAVEFSMDDGESWTSYDTDGATADKWVYWNYKFVPKDTGDYKLTARAVTKSGKVSPLLSSVAFSVGVPEGDAI